MIEPRHGRPRRAGTGTDRTQKEPVINAEETTPGPPPRRLVIDAHAHGTHLLPGPVKALHRALTRGQPDDVDFTDLAATSLDAIVVAAVGDSLVTRFRWPTPPWPAVLRQLTQIRSEALSSGRVLVTSVASFAAAPDHDDRRRPAVILGLEGADTVGEDLSRVGDLYDLGVRVVGVMHYADNAFGTICMDFKGGTAGAEVAKGRARGLTTLGRELIAELDAREMLIDLAHADTETILEACELSDRPVISSHTGARVLDDFPRYLPDHTIEAIAATGGVIGLWPYRGPTHGMATFDDFARHAEHIAGLVGTSHLCIGTDMNGVPSLLEGYRGPQDLPLLLAALEKVGFSAAEVDGISGGNIARLL